MAINKFSVAPGALPTLRYNFTSSGTLTVPAGVNYMYILAAGGGGNASTGGFGFYGNFAAGSAGGGSGGVAQGWVRVVPGETLTYTIAASQGVTTISSAGDFPFRFQGNAGGNGSTSGEGGQTVGTAGTASISAQALQFVNAGLGTLPTTTIGLGTAPHYSGAGNGTAGLAGGGIATGTGGTGLAGVPTAQGGAGISEIATTINGGVGGGGGGGTCPTNGATVGVGGAGAVRIYY
jgi:hypothetical protein